MSLAPLSGAADHDTEPKPKMCQATTMTLKWMAERLKMSTRIHVANRLYRRKKQTYIDTRHQFMKNKYHYLWLVPLIGIGIFTFLDQVYCQIWQQHLRFLRGTVERGIMMQMAIDEFDKQVGRYPAYSEFTNFYSFISSFQQGVTMTNKVTFAFDNSGGWFYNEKSGEISINSNGKYVVGFQSWVADLSKINFRPQMKVETMHFGRLKTLDYSYLTERADAYKPDLVETIKNWVATNLVTPRSIHSSEQKN